MTEEVREVSDPSNSTVKIATTHFPRYDPDTGAKLNDITTEVSQPELQTLIDNVKDRLTRLVNLHKLLFGEEPK